MIIGWTFFFLYLLTEAISYILISIELYIYHGLFVMGFGFFAIIWIDYINRDSVDPIKLTIYGFICGVGGLFLFQPGVIYAYNYPNGDPSFGIQGEYIAFVVAAFAFPGAVWVFYTLKVHLNAPKYLKRYSLFFLLGGFHATAVPLLFVALRWTLIIPGIDALLIGVGGLMTAIVIARYPQLGYILPFKAIKLAVISKTSNLILFLHKWSSMPIQNQQTATPSDLEDNYFSGMLYGINIFVRESIQKGEVREIITDEAVLLVHHHINYPVLFVLLATKSTYSLRTAFSTFVRRFVEKYADSFYQTQSKSVYDSAIKLIDDCFPFVPYNIISDKHTDETQPKPLLFSKISNEIMKTLKLCVSCKDIKNLDGKWSKMEDFLHHFSEEQITWEICPKCQEIKHTVVLSYFDQTLGPQIYLVFPEMNISNKLRKIPSIIEQDNSGFFLNTIGDLMSANYKFKITAPTRRGKEMILLLTYVNFEGTLNEKFARRYLSEFYSAISAIKGLDKAIILKTLEERNKSSEYHILKSVFNQFYYTIPQKLVQYYLTQGT